MYDSSVAANMVPLTEDDHVIGGVDVGVGDVVIDIVDRGVVEVML